MAFGRIPDNRKEASTEDRTFEPVFFDHKSGIREFRVRGNAVQVKRHWFEVNVNGKKSGRPFVVAVLRDGEWIGWEGNNFYANPINEYANTLPEDQQKKLWPATRFFVNVLDRTPVIIVGGVVHYPDKSEKYTVAGNPSPHNKVLVMEGSDGKDGGKHLRQSMEDVLIGARNYKTGERIKSIFDTDLRMIITGTGTDTKRPLSIGFDQDPLPEELMNIPLWDLEGWIKPWNYNALDELVSGADYNEVVKRYNVQLFPKRQELF
jgi:hypothetical protein